MSYKLDGSEPPPLWMMFGGDPDMEFKNSTNFNEIWESCRPKFISSYEGSVIIYGTKGNHEKDI